jgi:hypothetical protein
MYLLHYRYMYPLTWIDRLDSHSLSIFISDLNITIQEIRKKLGYTNDNI